LGKSAPTPPPAPDPNQIIDASTQANQQSALFQSGLNNVNYSGPQGNVSYEMNSPGRWTENVQLNPTEQATYDMADNAQYRAAKVADQQILNVGNALQNSNLQVPQLQTSAPAGALQTSYASGGPVQYGYNPGGAIQSQVAPTYSPFVGAGAQSAPAQQAAQAAQADAHAGMHYDQSSGWIPTQAFGVDSSGAHPGMMYDPSSGWVQADSRAVQPAQAPTPPGGSTASSGQASPYASMLADPVAATQLATYANARQMLDPQWSQAAEQQQAQLTAQGLNPNSTAYQNAMQIFGGQQNQAYDQAIFNAINAGNAEQNTLFGQNLSAGQFANQAQAQQYGENQGLAQFYNSAQGQVNAQNAAAAAFNNQSLGQSWQEQYANAQLANQAAQQQFQDQAYATQLPINEFTALMGSTQVGMPQSAPTQSTQVQPANALGAYELQSNAAQNTYDQQMQAYEDSLKGLYGLGSSALGGLGSFATAKWG